MVLHFVFEELHYFNLSVKKQEVEVLRSVVILGPLFLVWSRLNL